jgi:hypothetical protein
MDHVTALFLAGLGATCIYAGYRLFCDLPVLSEGRTHANRMSVLLMNVIPGLLLAVFGTALLTTHLRDAFAPRPAVRHRIPATEGTSWHPGGIEYIHRSV